MKLKHTSIEPYMLLQEAIKHLKPREEIKEKKLIKKTDYDLSILNRHGARSY